MDLLLLTELLGGPSNNSVGAPGGGLPAPVAGATQRLRAVAFDFTLSANIACQCNPLAFCRWHHVILL